jgi:isoleucyl-tRNA synthetase
MWNVHEIQSDRAAEINQQINWIPDHVKGGQMGHMLESAPDWSISRNRFWGTPIPDVAQRPSGKIIVCGSIAEIEQLSGQKVEDLHRPFIDNVTITKKTARPTPASKMCSIAGSRAAPCLTRRCITRSRIKSWFEENFPADFITEYIGQTRGWFNTLIMLSTALVRQSTV